MKKLIVLCIAVLTFGFAVSQVVKGDPYKVEPLLEKLAEIDVANQILPLLLSKDQIRQLMPVIERCRANVKTQERKEAERLKTLTAEAEKTLEAAVKGFVPKQEFLAKVDEMFRKFQNERTGVKIANQIILMEVLEKILNEGQKKAAIGVVDKVFNDEKRTWEDGTPQAKLNFFASSILLGDRAYEFLVKLQAAK